jgi:hypothetical protein
MAPERQLRIVQVDCALVLLERFRVGRTIRVTHTRTLVQWIVIALALWCAWNGFLVQGVIVRGPKTRPRRSATSTPFTRWRAGNMARLAFATSVGLYGLIPRVFGGPHCQANCLLALGMILLLVWKPGQSPNPQTFEPS